MMPCRRAQPSSTASGTTPSGFHQGVDISNANGQAVVASDSGVIVPVKQGGRGGNQVAILHPDGSVTVYSHTSSSVKIGDKVAEGEPIGCNDGIGNVRGGGNHVR